MEIKRLIKRAYYAYLRSLFARKEYRFFLRSAVANIDRKVSAQLAVTNIFGTLIRPLSLLPPFGKTIMVLAPHQDDEVIGCGGMMLLQRKAGYPVQTVFVQSGAAEFLQDPQEKQRIIAIREAEAKAAATLGGFEPPIFLRHAEIKVSNIESVAQSIEATIQKIKPDVIFSPFMLDPHADHTLTNVALALALKKSNYKCRIMGYEVWSNCIANVGIGIDEVVEEKKKLIACYKSQLAQTDYVHSTIGINMYHSRTFGEPGVKYVEMFFDLPSKEFIDPMIKVAESLWPEQQKSLRESYA